jgi:UDP-N-acetylglucosamine 4,6-dehydratase
MNRFVFKLTTLGRIRKRAVMMAYDATAMLFALWLAFCIRLGEFYVPEHKYIVPLALGAVALGLVALVLLGLYKVVIRYLDVRATSRLAIGAAAVAGVWFMLVYVSRVDNLSRVDIVPRSVGFIYFGIVYLLMFFGRLTAAGLLNGSHAASLPIMLKGARAKQIGVAIIGANAAASSLAESLRRHAEYRLRFFVDDNPTLLGRTMLGLPIRSSEDLREEVEAGAIEQVFLAMPSSTRAERMAALSSLSGMAVKVMTVPSYDEIMTGRYSISDVRPINVEDLLKRDIVPPLKQLIEEGLKGKSVLVTGAGGSIGSEICRQVVQYEPRRLVLFEQSEFALYTIETELQKLREQAGMDVVLIPVMGSLLDDRLVRDVLKDHDVEAVFHAAAYKHVPLLELNEVAGVTNNVVGTRILADACVEARIPRLTMISTDKAVRPTSVMGCSKRVAELYIQALAREQDVQTQFGIVRFGNVLDSSGSVVQHFRQQISAGGPVTVTHENITRFFMSIPEATQLVLQANNLAAKGEVFVLEMGEPIRIVDLARTMIALSGMTEKTDAQPDGDIEIAYVGLRPGEKLHEELFIGQAVTDTVHPHIKMAMERFMPLDELQPQLRRLDIALEAHDARAVRSMLKKILELDYMAADAVETADLRSLRVLTS